MTRRGRPRVLRPTVLDTDSILQEIHSPALREVVRSLQVLHQQIKTHQIDQKQATLEMTSHKHMIQAIALDWVYNRTKPGGRSVGWEPDALSQS